MVITKFNALIKKSLLLNETEPISDNVSDTASLNPDLSALRY